MVFGMYSEVLLLMHFLLCSRVSSSSPPLAGVYLVLGLIYVSALTVSGWIGKPGDSRYIDQK